MSLNDETLTPLEKAQRTINAAKDSAWVIQNEVTKLQSSGTLSESNRGNIQRNVDHLKLVVADQNIISSGEDITDLNAAITLGESTLASNPA